MSRRESLMDYLAAALDGAGKPAGVTVSRLRTLPFTGDQLPALVLYCVSESSVRGDGPRGYKSRRSLLVRVECRTRVLAGDDTPADTAIDPLVTWAVRALMADPTQAGLAINTQDTAVTWDTVDSDGETLVAAAVDVSIDYITAAGDPAAP